MKTRSRDGLLEFAAGEILKRVQTARKKWRKPIHDWLIGLNLIGREDKILFWLVKPDEHFELTGEHKISNQRLNLSVK